MPAKSSPIAAIIVAALATMSLASTGFAGDTSVSPVIGYGSSDAVLPAKNQELFYMGFELGLRSKLDKRYGRNALTVDQVSDGSQLGAVRSAKALIAQGVSMLVGFPTSHEALLAADAAAKEPVLALFCGAGHEKLAHMGDHVFTTGESMDYSVRSMLEFVKSRFPNEKGLLLVNPQAVFSLNQAEIARRIQSNDHLLPTLDFEEVTDGQVLSEDTVGKLQSGTYRYLIFTQYADESARVLQQMEDHGIDLPIFSNTSWTTGDVEFLRRLITRRRSETYSSALWLKGSLESLPFEHLVKKTYGREPTSEMAYGYDLGIIVAQTLDDVKKPPTRENVVRAFQQRRCFSELTSGRLCFPAGGGNADRKIYFVQFIKDHFVAVGGGGNR